MIWQTIRSFFHWGNDPNDWIGYSMKLDLSIQGFLNYEGEAAALTIVSSNPERSCNFVRSPSFGRHIVIPKSADQPHWTAEEIARRYTSGKVEVKTLDFAERNEVWIEIPQDRMKANDVASEFFRSVFASTENTEYQIFEVYT